MTPSPPTALIAEDEPLLAAVLQAELAKAWPQLQIVASVADGRSAVLQALALQPDVLFFDIRMPGLSGLEAAAELLDAWPAGGPGAKPFPALVFVTAYDQYAVQAFEAQAVDYLLKPIQAARLQKTVEKLQKASVEWSSSAMDSEEFMDPVLARLRHLLAADAAESLPPLTVIPASLSGSAGASVRMVPIDEVQLIEAADKYLRVLTAKAEYLIRTPLKDLLPRLDTQVFWQIHRGTLVRASLIDTVSRDEAGKLSLNLRGRPEKLAVSRLYAHLFRAM